MDCNHNWVHATRYIRRVIHAANGNIEPVFADSYNCSRCGANKIEEVQ
jgi:hypothetical protein